MDTKQTLRVSNMPKGMPTDTMRTQQDTDHTKIKKLIFEQRAITNARNRRNYSKQKAEGRNHKLKYTTQ